MKSSFGIFVFFGLILSLSALPFERINGNDETASQTHIRVRRQWGMPMGGFGMPMGGFGGPMGGFGGPMMGGWGMPSTVARSHGHATKFTSLQMPFISYMSGDTSGMGSSFMSTKK